MSRLKMFLWQHAFVALVELLVRAVGMLSGADGADGAAWRSATGMPASSW